MRFNDRTEPTSRLFRHNWTRPKRFKSQVNGQTQMTLDKIILRSDAKAHRW